MFINVKEVGTYNTRIFPCNYNGAICEEASFSSKPFIISEKQTVTFGEKSIKNESNYLDNKKVLLLIFPAVFLILIGIFLIYRKFKSGNILVQNHQDIDLSDYSVEENNLISATGIEILILYLHDESTRNSVKLLKDFLHKCANFKVTLLEDEIAEIHISPHDWIKAQLDYQCLNFKDSTSSKKRIILVEPNKAMSRQKNLSIEDLSMEDSFYCHALYTLLNNWPKCMADYCHLFVIEFNTFDARNQPSHDIVPGTCYTIPQHLLDLCIAMCSYEGTELESYRRKLSTLRQLHSIMKIS